MKTYFFSVRAEFEGKYHNSFGIVSINERYPYNFLGFTIYLKKSDLQIYREIQENIVEYANKGHGISIPAEQWTIISLNKF